MKHLPGRIAASRLAVALCLTAALFCAAAPAQEAAPPGQLTFGFLPIVSTERLVRRFAPLVDYLSRHLGRPVRMETAPDFETFLRRTQHERRYDLLFTAPHFYYLAQREAGYRALVRVDQPGMRAVIVAPRRGPLKTLADLRGRRLATVDPLALATLLVRARLEEAGLDPDRDLVLVSTPSHNASLLSALQGQAEAASLMLPLFEQAAPGLRASMRILAKTGVSPHMPISAAPWVRPELAARIRELLLGLRETPEGRALLEHLNWPGLPTVVPGSYEGLAWAAPALDTALGDGAP